MTPDAAHDPSVLVVDLAMDEALAEGFVLFGWSNSRANAARWVEKRRIHAEWGKKLALGEGRKRFAGERFDDLAKKDEAEVGVNNLLAGLAFQRLGHHASKQVAFIPGPL